MAAKLVFIETVDVVETTLALDNFRRACDCGRGAVFLSVARGKARLGRQPCLRCGLRSRVVGFGVRHAHAPCGCIRPCSL